MEILTLVLLIVVGILFVVFCVAGSIRWYANSITTWFILKKLDINKPLEEYANLLLAERGLVDVQVKKCGFFASFFVGNTYSVSKKTIKISWFASRHSSATTLAQVCRLVGLAQMHANGEKGLKSVEAYRWLNWLPILLLPLIIIGLIIDLVALDAIGVYTLIFSAVGVAITLFTFILGLVAMRKNFKAYDIGQELIIGMGILKEDEERKIKKLFSAWKKLAVVEVFINAFELIYFLLKLILSSIKIFGRK